MIKNFRYEEEGVLARSGAPQSAEEIDWLHEQGIRTVVSLHPVPEAARRRMAELGIQHRPFLIEDWATDVPPGLAGLIDDVRERSEEAPVLFHCQGGGGRAGTFFAAYLLRRGMPIDEVFQRVEGIDRDVNRAFLYGFAAGLRE